MFAEIYTPDCRAFAGYRRDAGGSFPRPPPIPAGSAEVSQFKDKQVALVRLIAFQGKPVATIYIRRDLQAMNDLTRNFTFIVAVCS